MQGQVALSRARWQLPARRFQGASSSCASGGRQRGRHLTVAVHSRQQQFDFFTEAESEDRTGDIVALARRRAGRPVAAAEEKAPASALEDFLRRLKLAWQILFPEQPKPLSPKEEGKQRLRMILVADRCGMSPESLTEMRQNIVKAVADYVDIEAEDLVEVSLTMDPELGTIYSVAVPVKRVKPQARVLLGEEGGDATGGQWDPSDHDSDPSGQFPYGA